jgi:hypothetical protein
MPKKTEQPGAPKPAEDQNLQPSQGRALPPGFDAQGETSPERQAHSINPPILQSGTTGKKIGTHSEEMMPGVDIAAANRALIPDGSKPQVPDLEVAGMDIPERQTPPGAPGIPEAEQPQPGKVLVEGTSEAEVFHSGGRIRKGQVVNVSPEDAQVLEQAGRVKRAGGGEQPQAPSEAKPPPSDANQRTEGQEG